MVKTMIENSRISLHAPRLSIIICIFNTDPAYFEECLESIYKETIENAEIIVVDDGSIRDYSRLISRYSPIYIKTENKGLLSARITGIKASRGKYVAFVDADDKVTSRYHKPMLEAAINCGCDMVIGEWAYLTDGGIRVHECELHTLFSKDITGPSLRKEKRPASGTSSTCRYGELGMQVIEHDCMLSLLTDTGGQDHTYYVMWNKIFRRELLEKSVAELERIGADKKGLTYGEDVLFNYCNYKFSGRILPFSYGLYLYRIHPSQSVSESGLKGLENQIRSMGYIFDILIKENKHSNNAHKIMEWRGLVARMQYRKARASGFRTLYPMIASRLGAPYTHAARHRNVYVRREAAGQNFSEIASSLQEIYDTGSGVEVFYEKKCRYLRRFLSSYKALVDSSYVQVDRVITVPKRRLSLIDMLVSSRFISTIGARFLPPESRLRAFVKRHMTL